MLKPISSSDTVPVVHPVDPAIDREKSHLEEYEKEYAISALVFKEGEQPTIFHLGSLSAAIGDEIDKYTGVVEFSEDEQAKSAKVFKGEFNDSRKAILAFRYCVRRIENMPGVECNEQRGHNSQAGGIFVADHVMRQIPRQVAVDIGRIALKLNRLGEGDRKNS